MAKSAAWVVCLLAGAALTQAALAGEASIVAVEVSRAGEGRDTLAVTVAHEDSGWDHYADAWHVEAVDGRRLGTRILAHPHVDEQPFTRSATITVPAGTTFVVVRARDKVHGLSKIGRRVELPTE